MRTLTLIFGWLTTIALGIVVANGQTPAPAQDAIVVGINNDYAPYEYLDVSGAPAGFDVDIVRAAAKAVYIKVTIQAGQWSEIRAKLEAKKLNLLAGMLYSYDRAKLVEFGAPYLLVEYAVFARNDGTSPPQASDPARHSILVEDGSQMHDHLKKSHSGKILPVASEPEALRQLAKGKGDTAMVPLLAGLLLIEEQHLQNIDAVEGPGFSRNLCFAAPKGKHDLIGRLNTGLAIIKLNGEYDRIYDKWFGSIVEAPSKWTRIGLWLGAVTIVLTGLAVAWVATLKRQVRERTRRLDAELLERSRIEADLRVSEGLYRALVEQSAYGIFVANESFCLTDVNEAGCAMFGMTRDEMVGKPVSSLFDPSHLEVKDIPRDRLLAGELIVNDRRAIRKDGSVFDVESRAKLISPGVFQGVLRDITEHKHKVTSLRRSNEELESRVRERTRELESFSYSVAHDLRSPLRAMVGYASILLREHGEEVSEESKKYLERISANANRMGVLIDMLLGYARLGRNPLTLTSLHIEEMVAKEWEELAVERNGRDIEFEIHPIPLMEGDKALVKLILQHLLSNSIKFTKDTPNAKIAVGYAPERKAVFVKDNGAGFDQRYANKLFRVFERLHSDEFEGTGVGLATVKRIVDRHGGDTWAEGVVGEGATFWFTFSDSASAEVL